MGVEVGKSALYVKIDRDWREHRSDQVTLLSQRERIGSWGVMRCQPVAKPTHADRKIVLRPLRICKPRAEHVADMIPQNIIKMMKG